MKNIKSFNELNENDENEINKEGLKSFNDACERFDFYGAFEIAQQEGLFGGDFDEYIEARSKMGDGFDNLIKAHVEFQKAAAKLKDLVIADVEAAQDDYGIPKTPKD